MHHLDVRHSLLLTGLDPVRESAYIIVHRLLFFARCDHLRYYALQDLDVLQLVSGKLDISPLITCAKLSPWKRSIGWLVGDRKMPAEAERTI